MQLAQRPCDRKELGTFTGKKASVTGVLSEAGGPLETRVRRFLLAAVEHS